MRNAKLESKLGIGNWELRMKWNVEWNRIE